MNRVRDLRVRPDLLYVATGWSTLVTDVHGRITGIDPQGFYARNTRMLSLERITVDGREPVAFSTANVGAHAQLSYAELAGGETLPSRALYLSVERFVGDGLRSRLGLHSYAAQSRRVEIRLRFAADFADSLEAESGHRQRSGEVTVKWDGGTCELRLDCVEPGLDRAVAVRVETTAAPRYDDGVIHIDVPVPPRGNAFVDLVVEPIVDGRRLPAPSASYAETDGADRRVASTRNPAHPRPGRPAPSSRSSRPCSPYAPSHRCGPFSSIRTCPIGCPN
jgi:hypothetical protein